MGEGTAQPGWYPVDDGARIRYWDGARWTDHIRDAQKTVAVPASSSTSRLRGAAQQLTSDAHDVPAGATWSAVGKAMGNVTTGRYHLDPVYLYYAKGTLRTDAQQVPVHTVVDVDVRQSLTQRARDVFTVVVHVQGHGGRSFPVTITDIPDGHGAARAITSAAHQARLALEQRDITIQGQRHEVTNTTRQEILVQGVIGQVPLQPGQNPALQMALGQPQAVQPEVPAAPVDHIAQLRELASLRDAGVLTEDEFASKKAEILSRM